MFRKNKAKKTAKNVPFRDIEKDGVTYSFLSEFQTCTEQARLSYVEGITEAGMLPALEFGQIFHLGFEHLAKQKSITTFPRIVKKYIDTRIKTQKFKNKDATELVRLGEIAKAMFPLYHAFWTHPQSKKNPVPRGLEYQNNVDYLAQEHSFKMEHTLPSGRKIFLRGRFDAILRVGKEIWIMENKTKSLIDEDGLTSYLPFDLQTGIYAYCVQKEFGEVAKGILYNVVKRPQQKWTDHESLEEHVTRVAETVAKDPTKYFMRWNTQLSAATNERFMNLILNPLLERVVLWWDSIKEDPFNPFVNGANPLHYINPEGLYTKFGRSRYFELITRGSTYGLERRIWDPKKKTEIRSNLTTNPYQSITIKNTTKKTRVIDSQ